MINFEHCSGSQQIKNFLRHYLFCFVCLGYNKNLIYLESVCQERIVNIPSLSLSVLSFGAFSALSLRTTSPCCLINSATFSLATVAIVSVEHMRLAAETCKLACLACRHR
uniref:Putative histidyl-trna synthetase n=1 Tax=Ixodes ricinus TaxID=34613 RepID=A0A0K8RJJ2_IXORI